MTRSAMKSRKQIGALLTLVILFFLLSIPDSSPTLPPIQQSAIAQPFFWNQDARWDSLEARYAAARSAGCNTVSRSLDNNLHALENLLSYIERTAVPPTASVFPQIEEQYFSLAPLIGACPERVSEYLALASRLRTAVKRQSEQWNMNDRRTRETLYRLLYGSRSAVEEVILQTPQSNHPPALLTGTDEPSSSPSAQLLGVTIHSGDILVSRGGAPTSALIARGSDFPGNFSHIALAHVDSVTGQLLIIESHIERGVAIATPDEYMHDTKLRVMVLRLRSDLPALVNDPLLPYRAASAMLQRAQHQHIPYDFTMDYNDTTQLFCSEVASSAYGNFGVKLWSGTSHISTAGIRSWLADFGVRNFETQEPSDLEYDPQVRVVAEWRDAETLFKDHIDNAVTDAMIEEAERGKNLEYQWYMLPLARLVKAYSMALNFFGSVGSIPEGMSATSALKHEYYASRHSSSVAKVKMMAEKFRVEYGFAPPFWKLLSMARMALKSP
jgi:hypothetical protein